VPKEVFSLRFLYSQLGDFYVKIIPKTRYRSHTYRVCVCVEGGGCNGSRGRAAIEPASQERAYGNIVVLAYTYVPIRVLT
jgi:hypothetical protein